MRYKLTKEEKEYLETLSLNNSIFNRMLFDYEVNNYLGESEYYVLKREMVFNNDRKKG